MDQAHEQVIFCSDTETGLKAIVAIHSAALGPALGGCRMHPYTSEEEALKDVLRLSEAMSYKSAMAGLKFGGGKSVIIADPDTQKNPELLWAFGSHIDSIKGRYVVAKDVGISTEDLQYIGDQTAYVVGRPMERGGVGDPSRSTAKGVCYGMKEAVQRKMNKSSLKGLKVSIQGAGAVGSHLAGLLIEEGAEVFIFDIKKKPLQKLKEDFSSNLKVLSTEEELFSLPCDIFSPCAMGFSINEKTVKALDCKIVAGGANNQLDSPAMAEKLKAKGILYIPDFIINSGGLIYVSSYLSPKKSNEWIENKIKEIPKTIRKVCDFADSEGLNTAQMALSLAKDRIRRAG